MEFRIIDGQVNENKWKWISGTKIRHEYLAYLPVNIKIINKRVKAKLGNSPSSISRFWSRHLQGQCHNRQNIQTIFLYLSAWYDTLSRNFPLFWFDVQSHKKIPLKCRNKFSVVCIFGYRTQSYFFILFYANLSRR